MPDYAEFHDLLRYAEDAVLDDETLLNDAQRLRGITLLLVLYRTLRQNGSPRFKSVASSLRDLEQARGPLQVAVSALNEDAPPPFEESDAALLEVSIRRSIALIDDVFIDAWCASLSEPRSRFALQLSDLTRYGPLPLEPSEHIDRFLRAALSGAATFIEELHDLITPLEAITDRGLFLAPYLYWLDLFFSNDESLPSWPTMLMRSPLLYRRVGLSEPFAKGLSRRIAVLEEAYEAARAIFPAGRG